jgi:murein DD-endopeptidase MepM/ murein hydrolase activator NlpD
VAEVRVFNPSTYTPRSFFAEHEDEERRTVQMAKQKRRHHHHHRRRHNPLGISSGVIKDSVFNTGGALAALFLSSQFNLSGWAGVGATGAAAVAASFAGKMVAGAAAGEEVLKGGLTATIISALHQAGFAKNLGLGLYAPSWFGVPTASSQYLRSYPGNMASRQGQGTVLIGASGQPVLVAPSGGVSGMGFHRFRSRYAGNY